MPSGYYKATGLPIHLGRHLTEEAKVKISLAGKGKKHPPLTKEHKKILSKLYSGERCRWWKGGISTYERKKYLNMRRWARKNNAEGSHTQGEWELLKKQYGYKCPCCKRKEPEIILTEDHIISLFKGGSDYIENIQPLCKNCNCKKRTRCIKYEQN
jgi:5-methylcytosine-specific restriction endonuclease McrA